MGISQIYEGHVFQCSHHSWCPLQSRFSIPTPEVILSPHWAVLGVTHPSFFLSTQIFFMLLQTNVPSSGATSILPVGGFGCINISAHNLSNGNIENVR